MTIAAHARIAPKTQLRMRVYLAGKCGGPKWDLVEGLPVTFTASDYKTHGMHLDALWGKSAGYGSHPAEIYAEVCREIADSDFLIAYLDTPDSFGSIAEIAWASAFSKKCFLLIVDDVFTVVDDELTFPMLDAYWLVSNFPDVIVRTVTKETARQAIEDILSEEKARKGLKEIRQIFESPLEEKFYLALTGIWKADGRIGIGFDEGYFIQRYEPYPIHVRPQAEVQTTIKLYRLDFLFQWGDLSNPLKCAVEIDGHDFHEKTKEQAKRDKERDRALVAAGYTVLRFTGSEVYHNAEGCAREVLSFIEGKK